MLPEGIKKVFQATRGLLLSNHQNLTSQSAQKQLREGSCAVLAADLQAERLLVPELCRYWSGRPVLCEEAENSGLADLINGARLLPYNDDCSELPPHFFSVDGLDGSTLYANGEFSLVNISAGLIWERKPRAAIVMTLEDGAIYYTINGEVGVYKNNQLHKEWVLPKRPLRESLVGVDDNRSVDVTFRKLVISPLMSCRHISYPLNVPSVAGGLKVLQGKLAAYVTSNARHWDIAGTAALCETAGMIVRCLDGFPVPWNQVRMPPIVFARDEEVFNFIQEQVPEYLSLISAPCD